MEIESTIVDKPWGHEWIWAKTDRYVGKILHVSAGEALSLQYHCMKGRDDPGLVRSALARILS